MGVASYELRVEGSELQVVEKELSTLNS